MRQWCVLLVATLALPLFPGSAHAQAAADPAVYVVSYVDVAFSDQAQSAALLRQLRDASRKESGNVRFEVLQRTAPSHQFVILEAWRDQRALDGNTAALHAKQFRERLVPHLIAPIDERLCAATAVGQARAGSATTVYVVTHVDVPPVSRDPAHAALTALAERSRQEAGNLRFDVVYQPARTNHFTVIEAWRDRAAYEAHEVASHTKAFRGELTPMTGALYDQRLYSAL